ncbi:MAG: hypothetical protein AAGD11_05390 [Planctomycetota bacterium]
MNTRCAPRCKNLDCGFERLIYKRYDRQCCRWIRESRESFLAQESSKPTMFFAHGNSLNHKNAMKQCWQVYCKMRCCPGPKRLVYWSWPAERVYKTERLRVREMIQKNLRIKYVYSEYQGYYMAKLVHQMSLSQRVMMAGHSYGGIISSAAAHYIGGGCLRGLTLAGGAAIERPNLRVGVISGAFDHDMLNLGNRYGQTFVAAEKVYVTRNIKDRTLKKWPKTSWRCKRAMGVLGVNANCIGQYRNKLCQQTMTEDVGTSHYLTPHLKSVKFVAALCCLSFPECNTCAPMASTDTPVNQSIPVGHNILPLLESPMAFELPSMTEESLQEDDSFASDETAMFESAMLNFDDTELFASDEFDSEEIDLASAAEFDASVLERDQPMLNVAADRVESRVDDNVYVTQPNSNSIYPAEPLPSDNYMAHHTSGPTRTLPTEAHGETTLATPWAATVQPTLPSSSQRTAGQPSVVKAAGDLDAVDGEPSNTLWYQCGLCLAIVLTGQFYVLFSKRVTPS